MLPQAIDAVFDISTSHASLDWLTPGKRASLLETCIWCLEECKHLSGIGLKIVIGKDTKVLLLKWKCTPDELDRIGRSHPEVNAIEFGAEAVSIVAIYEFTEYRVFTRAANKSGCDYFLSKEKVPGQLFSRTDARMEISGILNAAYPGAISTRVKIKQKQTTKSDNSGLPAWVAVVEFGEPVAHLELRHV